jgi:hypothetical protein
LVPEALPTVAWVSTAGGGLASREPDELVDRAAQYIEAQNLIKANWDFKVFSDMVDYCMREFELPVSAKSACEDAVREWFEQALIEAVLGVLHLRGRKDWDQRQIEAAYSEEALTVAVMPRYHLLNSIKRTLGSKFGKLGGADR